MAFDTNKFKQNIKKEEENKTSKINDFIEEFTNIVESEEFEDWLQKRLEYTNRHYNELMFYMGIDYTDTYHQDRFYFCISGDEFFCSDYHYDNIVHIEFGHESIALDKYEKEKYAYLDAMSECWKILKQKLKSLGLMITTSEPHWDIKYKRMSRKIEVALED